MRFLGFLRAEKLNAEITIVLSTRVRPLYLYMKLQNFNNLKSFVRNWQFLYDENLPLCELPLTSQFLTL